MNFGPEYDGYRLAVERVARLTYRPLLSAQYFDEVLNIVLPALNSAAGAVWLSDAAGELQLQKGLRLQGVQLDRTEESRTLHQALLRECLRVNRPGHFPPYETASGRSTAPLACNLADYSLMLAPLDTTPNAAGGVISVWQPPNPSAKEVRLWLQCLLAVSRKASEYLQRPK